jgi:hypothetical protein
LSSGNGLLLRSKRKDHMSVSGRSSGGNWDEIGIARAPERGSECISVDFYCLSLQSKCKIISEKESFCTTTPRGYIQERRDLGRMIRKVP